MPSLPFMRPPRLKKEKKLKFPRKVKYAPKLKKLKKIKLPGFGRTRRP